MLQGQHCKRARILVSLFSGLLITMITVATSTAIAQDMSEADGFNFPVGPRNPGAVTLNPADDDGWGGSGVGVSYKTNNGHSGEDWNDTCGGKTDLNAPVYAIADGTIHDVHDRGQEGEGAEGWMVVLKHRYDGADYYSVYHHIKTSIREIKKGDSVKRDDVIGFVGDFDFDVHFHFELRNKPVDASAPWPSDTVEERFGNAYYGVGMAGQERRAMDGIIEDPSAFILARRPASNLLERGKIPTTFTFDTDRSMGECAYDVRYLQTFLNLDADTTVATGVNFGALGYEVSNFGPSTQNALMRFQEKFDVGATATGMLDSETRDKINEMLINYRSDPKIDMALIIDSSGSMTSNDSANNRLDASRTFLVASRSGDHVGIVDFDSSVTVTKLMKLPESIDALRESIARIDSSGGTNIGAGIEAACDIVKASPSTHLLVKGAILLTDGQGGLSGQFDCFKRNGWPIYTFGLGNGVDITQLTKIATETGGEFALLPTSSLICEFQKVREKISGGEPPECQFFEILPLQTISFLISIEEVLSQATFSIDWDGSTVETTLISPDGRRISAATVADDVMYDNGPTYEIFTVTNPARGQWKIELFGADIPAGGEPVVFGLSSISKEFEMVGLDVRPYTDRNIVYPKSRGLLPVAILSTSSFDATNIDETSIAFGPDSAAPFGRRTRRRDVNKDGAKDLILFFRINEIGFQCSDSSLTISGETVAGLAFEGMDSITTIGCWRGIKN